MKLEMGYRIKREQGMARREENGGMEIERELLG